MRHIFKVVTMLVLVGAAGSPAHADSKTPIEKIKALVEEEFLPQMYAQVGVDNGTCLAGLAFDVHGNTFNTSKGFAKKISAQLKLNEANAWTVIDLVESDFNTLAAIRVVPMLCTLPESEEDSNT